MIEDGILEPVNWGIKCQCGSPNCSFLPESVDSQLTQTILSGPQNFRCSNCGRNFRDFYHWIDDDNCEDYEKSNSLLSIY